MKKDMQSKNILKAIYSYKDAENSIRLSINEYLINLIRCNNDMFQIGYYYLFPCQKLVSIASSQDGNSINFFVITDDYHSVVYGFDELLTSDLIALVEYLTD